MKLDKEEENIINNIKASKAKTIYLYLALGLSGLGLGIFLLKSEVLIVFVLFLSGFLCGFAVEKFYNIKIYVLCRKLYQDFISKGTCRK
jgi:hypothetical protein